MMQSIPVSEGQTLLDIALQGCGDLARVFEVAELNGIDITSDLTIGNTLIVPDPTVNKAYLVELFAVPYRKPKSGNADADQARGREGIDFWIIEADFIVQ